MLIVSREMGIALNFDKIVELTTGTKGTALVAKQDNERLIMLQEYSTTREAKTAVLMVAAEMERKSLVYVPDRDEVLRQIQLEEHQKYRSATGKKTKGHGGS